MSASVFSPADTTRLRAMGAVMGACGLVGILIAATMLPSENAAAAAWSGVLSAMVIPAWLSVGALLFLAVHLAAGATWITPYRSILSAMGSASVTSTVAFLAIAIAGGGVLYEWWHHPHFATASKNAWMSPWRWTLTIGVIIAAWTLLSSWLTIMERTQRPGENLKPAFAKWGVVALLVLVPTFTMFAWDALLALNASFISAMWGFYHLVGATQCAVAVLILIVLYLVKSGHTRLGERHLLHDLGTWMVAGACVVSYITFAQYAIISFANISEETQFFVRRQQHGYGSWYVLEAILRISPFFILMSQSLRTRPEALVMAALAALAGGAIDIAWIILPQFSPDHLPNMLWVLAFVMTSLGGAGLWLTAVALRLAKTPVAPNADPLLQPALNGTHLH